MPDMLDAIREARADLGRGRDVRRALVVALAIIGLLLLFWLSPFGVIGPGERGVHLRFTAVTGKIFGEGLYFLIPLIENVQKMNIQIQKEDMKADAASKDLQTVHIVVAMNYHIDPARVAKIFQEVGVQYKDRIIDPAMQEGVKASTAKFTAEELITRREAVRRTSNLNSRPGCRISALWSMSSTSPTSSSPRCSTTRLKLK